MSEGKLIQTIGDQLLLTDRVVTALVGLLVPGCKPAAEVEGPLPRVVCRERKPLGKLLGNRDLQRVVVRILVVTIVADALAPSTGMIRKSFTRRLAVGRICAGCKRTAIIALEEGGGRDRSACGNNRAG